MCTVWHRLVAAGSASVEIEGASRLTGACHTPAVNGMVIRTHSPKVLRARRIILELLMAGHTGPCVTDTGARSCTLHQMAADVELGPPRFPVHKPRYFPVEDVSPYVRRDLSRCILCNRCVQACSEIAGVDLLALAYRGSHMKVVVDWTPRSTTMSAGTAASALTTVRPRLCICRAALGRKRR